MDDEVRTDEDPRIGEVLEERYRIVEYVGGGAMADVYRAERLGLGREVAVKFLHPRLAADSAWVTRFSREAKAMSRLNHPHCVSVIDFGVAETPYIVMDLVTGQTLRELMDDGPVPFDRAIVIMQQVLAGLAHAHEAGIVHRDVKPANIVLTEATGKGDHAQVLDFGLARLVSSDGGRAPTTSKLVIGTPNYMAPEQSRGKQVDQRCDVYSAAVVLFELLTGRKPFEANGTFEVLRMHQEDPRPSIGTVSDSPKLDRTLDLVVSKAMARKPSGRFDSAIEFAAALDLALEASADDRPPAARRRWATPFYLALLVFAAGGVAGAWYLERGVGDNGTARVATDSDATQETRQPADASPPPESDASEEELFENLGEDLDAGDLIDEIIVEDFDAGPELAGGDAGLAVVPGQTAEPDAGVESADAGVASSSPKPLRPIKVERLADVKALLARGQRDKAIAGLMKLRTKQPKNGYIHLLLGHLYFQKRWWTNGLDSYRLALRYKRKYRAYATVNKNAIRALGGNKTRRKATSLILRSIGRSALPHLRRAAKSDRNSVVRKRAAALARRLRRRR